MKFIDSLRFRSLELELSMPVSLFEFASDCSSVVYSSDLIERLSAHLPFHPFQVLDVGSTPVFTHQILHLGRRFICDFYLLYFNLWLLEL